MGEFFKGWRRKVGVVALVMACVAMGGWVRSFYVAESIFVTKNRSGFRVLSIEGTLHCQRFDDPNSYYPNVYQSYPLTQGQFVPVEWAWTSKQYHIRQIPHWSIVLPLTLLSAYLLLVKPRVAKPKKAVEPTAAGGA